MRRLATMLVIIAVAAPAAAGAEIESGAPGARASLHVEEAQEHFDAERYDEALREYRAAYELVPEPMLTYNMAVCFERLEQRRDAIEHFQRYLREDPEADNAEEVRERIDRLHRERAEAQDEPLEVGAVDDESTIDRLDRTVDRTPLEEARHDTALQLGTGIPLKGVRDCTGIDWNRCIPFTIVIDYHYRLDPTWHIGGGLILEWAGATGGDRQSHYGFFLGGRYAFRPLPVLEVRIEGQLGYTYIDQQERAVGYQAAHWVFLRFGPTVAWDVYRGFGFRFTVDARLGYVDFEMTEDQFGAGLDVLLGIFWAV